MSEGATRGSCSLWDGELRAKGSPVASVAGIARCTMVMRLQPGRGVSHDCGFPTGCL